MSSDSGSDTSGDDTDEEITRQQEEKAEELKLTLRPCVCRDHSHKKHTYSYAGEGGNQLAMEMRVIALNYYTSNPQRYNLINPNDWLANDFNRLHDFSYPSAADHPSLSKNRKFLLRLSHPLNYEEEKRVLTLIPNQCFLYLDYSKRTRTVYANAYAVGEPITFDFNHPAFVGNKQQMLKYFLFFLEENNPRAKGWHRCEIQLYWNRYFNQKIAYDNIEAKLEAFAMASHRRLGAQSTPWLSTFLHANIFQDFFSFQNEDAGPYAKRPL